MSDFRDRNDITFKSVCGENLRVDQRAATVWKDDVVQMIEENPT